MKRVKSVLLNGGFTIAEVLLALAISSILLAAVAVAIHASFVNYQENEDIGKVIHSARLALYRITNDIRTADAADPCSPINECRLLTGEFRKYRINNSLLFEEVPPFVLYDGDDITYRYDSEDKKLYLVTNDDLKDPDYLVCDNVTAMSFAKVTFDEGMEKKVRSFNITMTVARGNAEKTITAAAVLRRNLRR